MSNEIKYDDKFYTKDADGTIATWYLQAWYGPRFQVTPNKNAKLHNYHRLYHMNDVGHTIFKTRKEAAAALPTMYPNGNYVSKEVW